MKDATLYILARTDLISMSRGRSDAQVSHATSDFHEVVHQMTNPNDTKMSDYWAGIDRLYGEWVGNRNFGRVIVLSVDESQMRSRVQQADSNEFLSGVTNDPSYPIRDGSVTHYISLDTCGWIFGSKHQLESILGDLPLLS